MSRFGSIVEKVVKNLENLMHTKWSSKREMHKFTNSPEKCFVDERKIRIFNFSLGLRSTRVRVCCMSEPLLLDICSQQIQIEQIFIFLRFNEHSMFAHKKGFPCSIGEKRRKFEFLRDYFHKFSLSAVPSSSLAVGRVIIMCELDEFESEIHFYYDSAKYEKSTF